MDGNFCLAAADLFRVIVHVLCLVYITYLVHRVRGKWVNGFVWFQTAFLLKTGYWIMEFLEHVVDIPRWLNVSFEEVLTLGSAISFVVGISKILRKTSILLVDDKTSIEELKRLHEKLFGR